MKRIDISGENRRFAKKYFLTISHRSICMDPSIAFIDNRFIHAA